MNILDFKPLGHARWIQNAVVPINDNCRLSVSYGNGLFYVGTIGCYEAALQMTDRRYPEIASLVSFKDNPRDNLFRDCDDAKLEELIELGKTLEYKGALEIFDTKVGDKDPAWGIRFLCAKGHDYEVKEKYVKDMWGDGKWRFIPKEEPIEKT